MSPLTPDDWRDILAYIRQQRTIDAPFGALHIGASGADPGHDTATVASDADLGVTWWIEDVSPYRFGLGWGDQWTPEVIALIRERVRKGSPGSQ